MFREGKIVLLTDRGTVWLRVAGRHTEGMPSRTDLPPWAQAWLFGLTCIAVITFVFAVPLDDVPAEVPALLLLIPITGASVLSSWRVGLPIALVAALVYGFVLLPPFGVFRVGYTQELVIMVTFVAVAIVVSILVSRRSISNRAELIGRERMMLLRSVSHDLRNPLNSILGASTELYDGADYDEETRRKLLRLVIDETRRLDRIVDNLLGLSRLQAGALDPKCEPIAVGDLIEQCESRFVVIGGESDRLDIDVPLPDLDVEVDPVQIDQVLCNLVENSVRHAPSPVHITIGVASIGPMVEWRVRDDGPGFSAAAREALYEPFHSSRETSGLGLTMCRAIVEAHGGTFTIDDDSGRGASVRFTVPRA
jgi:two-component system, OmpR family, sensor histidine kinase KdpD